MQIVSRSKCGTPNRVLVIGEGAGKIEVEKVPPGEMDRIESLPRAKRVLEGMFPFYEKEKSTDDDLNAVLDSAFPLVEAQPVEKATGETELGEVLNECLNSVFPW